MRLKKLTAAVLAGTMVLALTACGKDAPTQSGGRYAWNRKDK